MKYLLTIILLTGLQLIAFAQIKTTDLSETQLKGPVKNIVAYTFRGDQNGNVDTLGNPEKMITTFNKKGEMLEEVSYTNTGQLDTKCLFTYNKGVILRKQYGADGELQCTYTYKYDDNGNEIEFDTYADAREINAGSMVFHRMKTDFKVFYKYDSKGNRVEENTNQPQDNFPVKTIIIYDGNGKEIESDTYLSNGEIKEKSIFTYDASGNESSDVYNKSGEVTSTLSALYSDLDAKGNWRTKTSSYKSKSTMQGDFIFRNLTKRVITYY